MWFSVSHTNTICFSRLILSTKKTDIYIYACVYARAFAQVSHWTRHIVCSRWKTKTALRMDTQLCSLSPGYSYYQSFHDTFSQHWDIHHHDICITLFRFFMVYLYPSSHVQISEHFRCIFDAQYQTYLSTSTAHYIYSPKPPTRLQDWWTL